MMFYLPFAGALLFGYLLGSIPFGLLLTRAAGLGDVRKIGSGNIGATNVLRTGNKGLAAAKGTAAVLVAQWMAVEYGVVAGFGAFLGHLFPVWLGFRGGKGVATYVGVLFALTWQAGLVFAAVWIVIAVVSRYSSLSALVAAVVATAFVWWQGLGDYAFVLAIMTALIFAKHRANIARLLAGTESRIGAR
jgi:glycerol-3-phosphate acyltransferase PlsY